MKVNVKPKLVSYNGRMVTTAGFRAFVYSVDGVQKLVESYDEYKKHIDTGLYFDEIKDIPVKTKRKRRTAQELLADEKIESEVEAVKEPVSESAIEMF